MMQKLKDIGAAARQPDAAGTAAASVLHGERLRSRISSLKARREKDVMDLLKEANAKEIRMPYLVTLQIGSHTVEVLTSDLLLCTSPGRFHLEALEAKKVVEIPAELSSAVAATEADEDTLTGAALSVVGKLVSDWHSGCQCAAAELPDVLRTCNYLGAEHLLNGQLSVLSSPLTGWSACHCSRPHSLVALLCYMLTSACTLLNEKPARAA
jgi:hypothetical protein